MLPHSLARHRLVAAASLALLLVLGCGSGAKPVSVSGKVVLPPKVKVADTDSIAVTFSPEEAASGKSAIATVNPKDLTFTCDVVPGKYKVGFTIQPYAGMKDNEARTKELNSQVGMFDSNATPLRYEVTGGSSQSITLDLAQRTVSK